MTTSYPIKPPLYAITKSTNYLPNVLMQMEAKEAGFDNGVFIDAAGHVGECSNMNVAFVSHDGVLRHPKFDHILAGCTSRRLLELAPSTAGPWAAARRRGARHHRCRCARVARDAAARQLGQGCAHRAVGCACHRRRQTGTSCKSAPRSARGRHAHERSLDPRAVLTHHEAIARPGCRRRAKCPLRCHRLRLLSTISSSSICRTRSPGRSRRRCSATTAPRSSRSSRSTARSPARGGRRSTATKPRTSST